MYSASSQSHCDTLRQNTCYDILPLSFKVIVFDTELKLKKALSALIQHGVQSAPVWSSKEQKFIGMLTGNFILIVTDFIQLIIYYVDRSLVIDQALEEIENLTIGGLRGCSNLCRFRKRCFAVFAS